MPARKVNGKAAATNTTTVVASRKRKADDSPAAENNAETAPQLKKTKTVAKANKTLTSPKINTVPSQVLDVYVFGEGSSGELGLGSKNINGKKVIDIKRPRLNANLSVASVGVVQIACGGMHAAALTRDNKILTWGVNDQGALGRDTNWDGGLRDIDADDDDEEDDDDTGINPHESTPTAVLDKYFPAGTKFVQVVACDSATFVLTEGGRIYGWGTFRSSDGILGFSKDVKIQDVPALLPDLKNIKAMAAGANHVLALDNKGHVLAWGCGQQNQLGRRVIERNRMSSLTPQGVRTPRGKVVKIACGAYHSFLVDDKGQVYGWGLNNFGELGSQGNAGQDEAVVLHPAKLTELDGHKIVDIDGGVHHSLACSENGELFTWGRVDGYQIGIKPEKLNRDDVVFDNKNNPRILVNATKVPDVSNVTSVAAGSDNSFAVTRDGKVYSWGFSGNYQTGQGTIEDIETPTVIDNTAIRGKSIIGAGAGGQFSVLVGIPDGAGPQTNGTKVNGNHA